MTDQYIITEEQITEFETSLKEANRIGGSYKNGEADALYDIIRVLRSHPYNPQADPCQERGCDDIESCDEICKNRKEHREWQSASLHDCEKVIRQAERDVILDRLDKEIHIREDEMNRKAGLEDNLVTVSGYYASAGALNWVRKVLIDGLRETIRQEGKP